MRRELSINMGDEQLVIPVRISMRGCRFYRAEFGRDLVTDLYAITEKLQSKDVMAAVLEVIKDGVDIKDENALYSALFKKYGADFINQETPMSFEDMETAGKILWSFAKNENDALSPYERWIDSISEGVLPLQNIAMTLYALWNESAATTVELKN